MPEVTHIEGRLLRPVVCSCVYECRSREEMRIRHGDPEQFANALADALGEISFAEAERANLRYRKEWASAPEKTEVDK